MKKFFFTAFFILERNTMSKIYREKSLQLDDFLITVQYKDVKRLSLRMKPDGNIMMSVPAHVSWHTVQDFAEKSREWLVQTKKRMQQQRETQGNRPQYKLPYDGEHVYIWGQKLDVIFIDHANSNHAQVFMGDRVIIYVRGDLKPQHTPAHVEGLYCDHVAQVGQRLLEQWAVRMGVQWGALRVRTMKTRWGTCNVRTHVITLNTLLACYPPKCLEYIVVHELAHLLEPNHSPRFHAIVEQYLPDWRERKQLLRTFSFVI